VYDSCALSCAHVYEQFLHLWLVRVRIEVMRCWCGYLSGATCTLFAYGPAYPLPCFIYIRTGFTFLVSAYPGCPATDVVVVVVSGL